MVYMNNEMGPTDLFSAIMENKNKYQRNRKYIWSSKTAEPADTMNSGQKKNTRETDKAKQKKEQPKVKVMKKSADNGTMTEYAPMRYGTGPMNSNWLPGGISREENSVISGEKGASCFKNENDVTDRDNGESGLKICFWNLSGI